jgi:hypothetical protein
MPSHKGMANEERGVRNEREGVRFMMRAWGHK